LYEDVTPAPPMLDSDAERGWMVGQVDRTWLITFNDPSRPPLVGEDAVTFYTNNKKESVMPTTQANFTDENVDQVSGLIERYTTGLVVEKYIGAGLKSALGIKQVRQPWCDLRRECTIAYVSLDLSDDGRPPMNAAPGVEQIVWLGLPEWHPAFEQGEREVAVLRYLPSTTYTIDVIKGTRVEQLTLASAYDTSGYVAVIGWCQSLEQAETQATELRQAVQTHNRSGEARDEMEEDVDPAAGRFGSKAAWGL